MRANRLLLIQILIIFSYAWPGPLFADKRERTLSDFLSPGSQVHSNHLCLYAVRQSGAPIELEGFVPTEIDFVTVVGSIDKRIERYRKEPESVTRVALDYLAYDLSVLEKMQIVYDQAHGISFDYSTSRNRKYLEIRGRILGKAA